MPVVTIFTKQPILGEGKVFEEGKMGFRDRWNRVRQVTRLKKQSQLAEFLGVSSSNTSQAKLKDRFPLQWAFKIGQAFNISTDWIMTGKGLPAGKPGEEESDETLSEENQVKVV